MNPDPQFEIRDSKSLLEFPMSTVRILGHNFPISGGGYFRLLPLALSRWALTRIPETPFIFYIHPWELDPDQPRIRGLPVLSQFRHYVNLGKTQDRLKRLINAVPFCIRSHLPKVGRAFFFLMVHRRFHSLPPAGNKIALSTLWRAFREGKPVGSGSLTAVKDYLQTRHLLYLSSGRTALWVALKAFSRLRPHKKEVIVPAYTCPAVISAILKAGLHPVLSDISLTDFGYAEKDLERKINERTLAVIIVHLLGYPAPVTTTVDRGRQEGFFVIEDAAQGFGNSFLNPDEKKLGLAGDAGIYSFGRGKPIGIFHGGCLTTQSDEIFHAAMEVYEKMDKPSGLQRLKYPPLLIIGSLFSRPFLYWIPRSLPFLHLGETIFEPDFPVVRGMDVAARLIGAMLDSFEQEKEIRVRNSHAYASNLLGLPGVKNLAAPAYPYLRFPFIVKSRTLRDRILERCLSEGTGGALLYPCPLNELPGMEGLFGKEELYPNAKHLSETLMTLPVHPAVKQPHLDGILRVVREELLRSAQK